MSKFVISSMLMFALTGCVSMVPEQSLPSNYYATASQEESITVLLGDTALLFVIFPGANCILCKKAANATHRGLIEHTGNLDLSLLSDLRGRIATGLSERGFTVNAQSDVSIFEDLEEFPDFSSKEGFAKTDFRSLREAISSDQLLWVQFTWSGFQRFYFDFIPTSDPSAFVNAQVTWVDLKNNKLILKKYLNATAETDEEWKNPPDYPELSEAFYSAASEIERQILEAIFP